MIMTVLTLFYVLASLRTNIILVIVFFFIDMAFFMLMATYWCLGDGNTKAAAGLQVVCYKNFRILPFGSSNADDVPRLRALSCSPSACLAGTCGSRSSYILWTFLLPCPLETSVSASRVLLKGRRGRIIRQERTLSRTAIQRSRLNRIGR